MSKVALISDIHFGARKNNTSFLESMLNFFKNEFIPHLNKNDITDIYILGDFFDSREAINVKVKDSIHSLFKNDLKDFNITMLLGNHDIFYRNTLDVNSLKFIGEFDNVTIIDKPTGKMIGDKNVLLVPWQIDDSILSSDVSEYDVCFGHFDINGFYLNKTTIFEGGFSPSFFFDNFKMTFSGHFHLYDEQSIGDSKIIYLGSPYHLNRSDIDTDKGFIILDTDNLTYERVLSQNTIKYIVNVWPNKLTKEEVEGNIIDVHIIISDVYDESAVNEYTDELDKWNPIQVQVFPKYDFKNDGKEINVEEIKSIDEIITTYVDERLELSTEMRKRTLEYILNIIEKAKKDNV
jgi:DNA repair exonuclease SbcCD nuclease subunit